MFDISVLKTMKLPELQEIAKLAKTIKFNGVKKEVLIDLIVKSQEQSNAKPEFVDKPKRARIKPETAANAVEEKIVEVVKSDNSRLFNEEVAIVDSKPKFVKKPKFIYHKYNFILLRIIMF